MRAWLVLSLVFLGGCGASRYSGGGGGATGGIGGGGEGGQGGEGGAAGESGGGTAGGTGGSGGINCGVQDFTLEATPPDLLIVLDKSGSMRDPPMTGQLSKWVQVTSAINQVTMTTQNTINWGLKFFPTGSSCVVDPGIEVNTSVSNAQPLADAISRFDPGGWTPTRAAVTIAGSYLAGLNDGNPHFLLLATDGEPTCADGMGDGALDGPATEQAVTDVANMGVHTFVVGISTNSQQDEVLNQMAQNGLEPRASGPPYYYPVASQAELEQAMATIAGAASSCTFSLARAPMFPEFVTLEFDGRTIPRDTAHANGWDFDANMMSISLFGSACTDVKHGQVITVRAVYGCPPEGRRP